MKTRLAKDIGDKKATEFYRICLNSAVVEALVARNTIDIDVFFCFADVKDAFNVRKIMPQSVSIFSQVDDVLPKRIQNAFKHVFDMGYEQVCIYSTDVPSLDAGIIIDTFEQFNNTDTVLGPDGDGGYFAFGMNKYYEDLFMVQYGSDLGMFEQTLHKLDKQNICKTIISPQNDVDTLSDLNDFKNNHPELWSKKYNNILIHRS